MDFVLKHNFSKYFFLLAVLIIIAIGFLFFWEKVQSADAGKVFVVKMANAQAASYGSLGDALSAIGSKDANLIVQSNKTWNISSNTTIPANIEVEVRKGGIFNISAGATLTIKGGFKAGNYRIFDGSGKVDFSQGEVNVIWFTNGGDGRFSSWTGANDQGGIGEAVSRTVKGHIYNLPPGSYSVGKTITVNKHGSVIQGKDIGEDFDYVSNRKGSAASIWITSSSPIVLFDFDLGYNGEMLRDCAIRGIHADSGELEHTIIRATNTSNFEASYIDAHKIKGTGIEYRGKENGLIKKVILGNNVHFAIKISKNPRSSDGIDIDTLVIRDLNSSCRTSQGTDAAHVTMADGLVFNNISLEGQQGWQTCFYGVYWNDTSSTKRSGSLVLSNQKFESCSVNGVRCTNQTQYASYAYYIKANAGLDQLTVKQFSSSERQAGLVYAKNVKSVKIGPGSYGCIGDAGTGVKTCYLLNADNVNSATIDGVMTYGPTKTNTPGMTLLQAVTGSNDVEKDFRKIFIRQ